MYNRIGRNSKDDMDAPKYKKDRRKSNSGNVKDPEASPKKTLRGRTEISLHFRCEKQ